MHENYLVLCLSLLLLFLRLCLEILYLRFFFTDDIDAPRNSIWKYANKHIEQMDKKQEKIASIHQRSDIALPKKEALDITII